jgi:hypothetical protein
MQKLAREATMSRIVTGVLLASLVPAVVAAQSVPARKDIPAIAKSANGSIVSIVMSDKDGKAIGQGSGFFVSKDGLVVTNYHVIAEGSSAVVKLPDGAFYVVDGLATFDKERDVAIIKVHGQNFRTLTLGNSDRVQVGEEVVAIGNPLSLESTVSNGIVSGIRTSEDLGGKFLQITTPISPGSSGGPLFNMAGDVVGITTMYLKGGENLNFAIPINDAKHMLLAKSAKMLDLPNEPPKEIQSEKTHAKATLAEQKMCSEQADQIIHNRIISGNDQGLYTYDGVSHYDASTGICYMEISRHRRDQYAEETIRDIQDAFGGGGVGYFGQIIAATYRDFPHKPFSCKIYPPGQPEIKCTSEEEFNDLALKYFGIPK